MMLAFGQDGEKENSRMAPAFFVPASGLQLLWSAVVSTAVVSRGVRISRGKSDGPSSIVCFVLLAFDDHDTTNSVRGA